MYIIRLNRNPKYNRRKQVISMGEIVIIPVQQGQEIICE